MEPIQGYPAEVERQNQTEQCNLEVLAYAV